MPKRSHRHVRDEEDDFVLECQREGWVLIWQFLDPLHGWDLGGMCGPPEKEAPERDPLDRDKEGNWRFYMGCVTAQNMAKSTGAKIHSDGHYYWDSQGAAIKVLKAYQAVIAAQPPTIPDQIPEWHALALAAGWTPPKPKAPRKTKAPPKKP